MLIDPAEKVVQHSVIAPIPVVLSPEEVKAVMEAAQKMRTAPNRMHDRMCWSVYSDTAIKKGECLTISPIISMKTLRRSNTLHSIRPAPATDTKNAKSLSPTSGSELITNILHNTQSTSGFFPGHRNAVLEYLLEDLGEAAGLISISPSICAAGHAL